MYMYVVRGEEGRKGSSQGNSIYVVVVGSTKKGEKEYNYIQEGPQILH